MRSLATIILPLLGMFYFVYLCIPYSRDEASSRPEYRVLDMGEPFKVVLTDTPSGMTYALQIEVLLLANPHKALDIQWEFRSKHAVLREEVYDVFREQDPDKLRGRNAATGWSDIKSSIHSRMSRHFSDSSSIQQVLFDNPIFSALGPDK